MSSFVFHNKQTQATLRKLAKCESCGAKDFKNGKCEYCGNPLFGEQYAEICGYCWNGQVELPSTISGMEPKKVPCKRCNGNGFIIK